MKTSGDTYARLRIGDLELDAGIVSLQRGDEEIALPKLSFDLLLCLARHAPNVVSTDQLMDEVWGRVVVGEETVKQRVKLLRQALGDSGSDPRYIASVRGRGYRLLVDVSPLTGEAYAAPSASAAHGSRRTWLAVVTLLAVVVIGFLAMSRQNPPEGLTTDTREERARPGSTDNAEAWEAYTKGRAAYRRWTRQDNETALAFYQRSAELDPGFALAFAGAANANALRATEFGLGEEWIDTAIEQARRALELEPDLPEALKALGICYVYRGEYRAARDYYRSALRLDPDYDEVIFNIAEIENLLGHWDKAVEYQQRDSHRARGLERLAIYLRDLGFDDRAAALEQAFEQELPVSFFSDANRSLHDLLNGDYERARATARRMQRALPGAADGWLREGEIDLLTGNLASAARHFEAARQAAGGFQAYANLRLAQIGLLEGNTQSAERLLQQAETSALQAIGAGHEGWFHRWNLALAYALSDKQQEAINWFEQAISSGRRRYEWDELEPAFQSLMEEPRFRAALQQQRELRREMQKNVAILLTP